MVMGLEIKLVTLLVMFSPQRKPKPHLLVVSDPFNVDGDRFQEIIYESMEVLLMCKEGIPCKEDEEVEASMVKYNTRWKRRAWLPSTLS